MAITVFVWLPGGGSPGHASMNGSGFYVSWWPDVPAGWERRRNPAPDGFYFSGMPGRRLSIGEDKKAEKRIPDYASAPINGLDEKAISQWWSQTVAAGPAGSGAMGKETKVKRNSATYAVFTSNCSAMVIRGLLIGGAYKSRKFDFIIQRNPVITPRVVKDAAEALTGDWSEVFTNASTGLNLLRDAYELIDR